MRNFSTVLWIDRWKKYIWLASVQTRSSVVMPIGYMMNEQQTLYDIAGLCVEKRVSTIVVGWPGENEDGWYKNEFVCSSIKKFVKQLSMCVDPDIDFVFVDEHYSSVEAGEKTWNFTKNETEDTLAAMVLLERWLKL